MDDENDSPETETQASEAERLRAEKAEIETRLAGAEARAALAERRAALAGKVVDTEAALRLLDPDSHLDAAGAVDADALLESYPFLAPAPSGPAPSRGGGGAAPRGGYSEEDLRRMTPAQINERWPEIRRSLGRR